MRKGGRSLVMSFSVDAEPDGASAVIVEPHVLPGARRGRLGGPHLLHRRAELAGDRGWAVHLYDAKKVEALAATIVST
jgi:hypothetical protein